jgi:hypothetical protein
MLTPRRYRDPAFAPAIAAELNGGRMRELHVFDDGHLGLVTAADELGPGGVGLPTTA